ncbi:hypothetical protein AVEN_97352-1 [Araneus ventricosus]|uniref:Uncharacterized protein n=1 Tax=Araneus ventricosus TaxID=182803 RepID=A0A4Y2NU11_ARAVE|nr:hypothetical protein AVEN_97352-1 [Araneus ventricosus]
MPATLQDLRDRIEVIYANLLGTYMIDFTSALALITALLCCEWSQGGLVVRSRPHDRKTPSSKPGSTIDQLYTWTRRMPNPKSRVKHSTVGVGRKPREEVLAQVSSSLSD